MLRQMKEGSNKVNLYPRPFVEAKKNLQRLFYGESALSKKMLISFCKSALIEQSLIFSPHFLVVS